ncbi:hypothetical protein [Thalassorhabdomicrobium marinisediminis]|uniref:Uncharacterized protein n=1 Tax=Thalassorhabdomicrobium marinisediminis TaxID=2170577 RepID=A0A2T7FXX7_9RHOB|nr:hypothetical protein [Thalassorhabdomicrobium marinisediminis]PVA07015.1 hypothetical protein DC363_07695 [Thalassorhabdomicrobium marinisediminis]
MTYEWLIVAAIVLVAVLPIIKWLRRLLWAFSIAFFAMMIVHMQHNPGEATLALGAMGGGLLLARPVRRLVLGGML